MSSLARLSPVEAASLFGRAGLCLQAEDPDEKCVLTEHLYADWLAGSLSLGPCPEVSPVLTAGRPAQPLLVPPSEVPRRKLRTPEGRAALIHALAHIEFNAINLAVDAVYRFRDMPHQYYSDWLKVAVEEAYHFGLLRARLVELGHAYGDFAAHNGLWDMAVRTAHDVLPRMAVVPRVLEARGLDVTPGMISRLRQAGDEPSCGILEIILRDEIGHVAIGSHWYGFVCAQRGLEPEATFRELVAEYVGGSLRGPFDHALRKQAGFSESELLALETGIAGGVG